MKRRPGLIGLSGFSQPDCACSGLGDTDPWHVLYADTDEVFVWRATLHNVSLRDPTDALAVLRSVAIAEDLNLDVRGIAVEQSGSSAKVDVVLTTARARIYPPGVYDDAADIALKVASDAALRTRFAKLSVTDPKLLQLTGPPDAVDFWRAHAVVWSTLLGEKGAGGPTSEFGEGRGAYVGKADDGPRLKPWTAAEPALGPEPARQDYTALWVMGGLVLAWLLVRAL